MATATERVERQLDEIEDKFNQHVNIDTINFADVKAKLTIVDSRLSNMDSCFSEIKEHMAEQNRCLKEIEKSQALWRSLSSNPKWILILIASLLTFAGVDGAANLLHSLSPSIEEGDKQ